MSASFKNRAKAALDKYLKANDPSAKEQVISRFKKKKNKRTEYDMVVQPCIIWLKRNGFSPDPYESRAVWDSRAQGYVSKGLKVGHPDIGGCSPLGFYLGIECKAPGKRATLKDHQRAFLVDKIEHGAFCVVVDSVELLEAQWAKWASLRAEGLVLEARDYLLENLPKGKEAQFKLD